MSVPIPVNEVALSLMREALTLRDSEETAGAAAHLRRAIRAVEDVPEPPPEEISEGEHVI